MMFLVEKRNGGTQGREIATSNFEGARAKGQYYLITTLSTYLPLSLLNATR